MLDILNWAVGISFQIHPDSYLRKLPELVDKTIS